MSLQKQGVLRRSSIDPRTVLLSVLVINAVALSHGHLPTLLISIAFSSIALATVKPHYGLICLFAFALSYLGYWGLLQLPGSTFFAFSAAI
ncbi:energy-coupling factor transporter transmembrane protein EcfT, partial [Corynebacterium striatum]